MRQEPRRRSARPWSSSGEGIKPFSKTDFTEDLKKFDVPTLIQICVRSYVVIELILFASGYVGRSSTSHVRLPSQPGTQSTLYSVVLPSQPGTQSTLYSVVLPSKCSL